LWYVVVVIPVVRRTSRRSMNQGVPVAYVQVVKTETAEPAITAAAD
jgi:hypothetical protein